MLTELPRIQQTGFDFDSVIAEIREILLNNPNWSDNWSEFYDSEAGVLLTQLMAWVMDNMSSKQDVLLNEMFLSTAQIDENKLKLLKQIAYVPRLASAAKVALTFDFSNAQSDIVYLTRPNTSITNRINDILKINGKDINGATTTYEVLAITDGKPNYLSDVALDGYSLSYTADMNNNTIYALEGSTRYMEFTTETDNGSYFDLEGTNIAADSIQVYVKSTMQCLKEVNSFVSQEALDSNKPCPYVIETNLDRTLRIRFGNKGILDENRRLPAGTTISVFYRTTSGSKGNINPNFINATVSLKDERDITYNVRVYNTSLGEGGSEAETIDEASLNGPLSLRTMDRAVTPDDYNIILNRNPTIFKSKTYTSSNQPDGFKDYYGRYINPQESFSIVMLKKNYADVPASQYNNFPWITLNKEPRLNERYVFNSGNYNNPIELSPTYFNYTIVGDSLVKTFKNATILDIGKEFNDALLDTEGGENSNLALKISTTKQDEKFFSDIKFNLMYNDDEFETTNTTIRNNNFYIFKDENARFVSGSEFDITEPVDVSSARYLSVSIDNKQFATIDLWAQRSPAQPGAIDTINVNGVAYLNQEFYLLWDNEPTGTADGYGKDKASANTRKGIVQLINEQYVALFSNNEMYEYEDNTSYQYLNLDSSTDDYVLQNITENANYAFKLKGVSYSVSFSRTGFQEALATNSLEESDVDYTWNSLKGIRDILNAAFTSSVNLKRLEGTQWKDLVSETPLESLEAIIVQNTHSSSDYDDDGNADTYGGFDLVFKSNGPELLSNGSWDEHIGIESKTVTHYLPNVLWFENSVFDSNHIDLIQAITGKTTINTREAIKSLPIQAVDYSANNIALMLDGSTENRKWFCIRSLSKGVGSSVWFKLSNNDFMSTKLGVSFDTNGYSYKAYGEKKLLFMKKNVLSAYNYYEGNQNYIFDNIPQAGNLIFENSCIFNSYDFEKLYANYKTSTNSSFVLGSVYDNFYYSNDTAVNNSLKEDVTGIEGQFMDVTVLGNGTKVYAINKAKSNLAIKFTTSKQDVNSLYAIEEDMDIVESDRISILTNSITSDIGGPIKIAIDDYSGDGLYIDLEGCTNGSTAVDRILTELSRENGEMKSNASSIVSKSFFAVNQIKLQNLDKEDGKFVFKWPYSGNDTNEVTTEKTKTAHKNLFGTNITNPDLYRLYTKDMFNPSCIFNAATDEEATSSTTEYYYCPTVENSLEFTYRKLITEVVNGELVYTSRPADYYIAIAEGSNGDQNVYRFTLNKTNNSKFPDAPFYVHFVNDKTYNYDSNGNVKENDETVLQNYMKNYKISGMEATFIKPYFKTYDVAATIKYNGNFSISEIVSNVNKNIDELCSLEKAEIAGSMSRAKILKAIMNVNGVEDCKITYFGFDYNNQSANPNSDTLTADFYEIMCLNDTTDNTGKILTFELMV